MSQRPIINPTSRLRNSSNLHHSQTGSPNAGPVDASHQRAASEPETKHELDIRLHASRILASYEQLVWNATARNESIVQTRLHFEAILAGLPAADTHVKWPTVYQDTTKAAQGKSPAGKGKASASHTKDKSGEGASSSKKKNKDREAPRRSLGGV